MEQLDTCSYSESTSRVNTNNIKKLVKNSEHYSSQKAQLLLDHKTIQTQHDSPATPGNSKPRSAGMPRKGTANGSRYPASPQTQTTPSKLSSFPTTSTFAMNFSKRNINQFPKAIRGHLTTLHILDLTCNQFTEVPAEVLAMTTLKTLKLDNNYIKSLPQEISQLTKLETLTVSNNFLTAIPRSICKLNKTLTVLNLAHNHIEQIPAELTQLSVLKVLWLNNNSFTALPITFNALVNLKELALEWFKYTNPPLAVIQNDKHCEKIKQLFALCNSLRDFNVTEINFEEFIANFSQNHEASLLNSTDSHSRNLLHIAALAEEVGIIRHLLSQREQLINQLDQDQQSPLSLSIREEKYFISRILLFHGADPKLGGGAFGSCLHMATSKLQLNLVKELLKYGANPNSKDYEGNTPLHLLCLIFSKDSDTAKQIAKVLLESGANTNAKNGDLWAPIHLTIRRGHLEGLRWLLRYNDSCGYYDEKRRININCKGGPDKWCPLHLAANLGQYEMTNLLIEHGADFTERTKTGRSVKAVCQSNLLLSKTVKKLEDEWVRKQLFKGDDLGSKLKEISLNSNVQNLKTMISSSMTMKSLSSFPGSFLNEQT